MATDSQTPVTILFLWAIAWALALVATAILFKGNPIKDWVQSALYLGAISFWFWKSRQLARHGG
jgi:hypothetical protein